MKYVRRISLCCLLLFITCILCSCSSKTYTEETHEGEVQAPIDSELATERNYEDVVKQFEVAGFKDVKTREVPDLITGWITKEGDVDSVSINGDTDYSTDDWYPQDASVVVAYHTFRKKNKKSTSKNAKKSKEKTNNKNSKDTIKNKKSNKKTTNKKRKNKSKSKKNNAGGIPKIGIGDKFRNKTISGVITNVNLNYKNYDDLWTDVPKNHKVILVKIKLTNISKSSNYVSVGDFDCYVNNVATDPEMFDNYNANIEAGRSAVLKAVYVIPKKSKSIELEYNPIGESAKRVIIKIK